MSRPTFPIKHFPPVILELLNKHKNTTDAPEEYLAMGFLSVAASLAGAWNTINGQQINEYFLLIGSSGVARKSTALKLISDFRGLVLKTTKKKWRRRDYDLAKDNCPLTTDAYTSATTGTLEGFEMKRLGSGVNFFLVMDEFRRLFDSRKNKNIADPAVGLTFWYDGHVSDYVTVGREGRVFSEFGVTILGASTESWLSDMKSSDLREGGFLNRFLIVPATRTRQIQTRSPAMDLDECLPYFDQLIPDDLRLDTTIEPYRWAATVRTIEMDPSAKGLWGRYYQERDKCLLENSAHWLSDIIAREMTHALKLAAISARLKASYTITKDDLTFGIKLARWCTRELAEFAAPENNIHEPWNNAISKKIFSRLSTDLPVTKRILQQSLGGNVPSSELNKHLDIMFMWGWVSEDSSGLRLTNAYATNTQQRSIEELLGSIDENYFRQKESLNVDGDNHHE